jgi:L-rhamnose mutarotase
MVRMGWLIGVDADRIAEYKRLHADVWPGVRAKIAECNIRNYTIYLREPENLLFGHFEYHGSDWSADEAKMAADPETQRWWAVCKPCQSPLASAAEGEWWAPLEEVFHAD